MLYQKFQKNKYKATLFFISSICVIFLMSCGLFNQNAQANLKDTPDISRSIEDVHCDRDSDCVLVDKDCCGRRSGGDSTAIHFSQEKAYNQALRNHCSTAPPTQCRTVYLCNNFQALCDRSRCVVEKSR